MKSGSRVFRQHPHRAAFEALRHHCGRVPTPAVQPEELAAVGAEFDRAGRHGIVGADPGEEIPSAIRAALQILDVAVVGPTVRRSAPGTGDR